MRRHAVLERFEIADERVGVYPALLEGCQIRGVRVQTLSPGDELHAAEQKVERVGARRAPRIRMGVEGSLCKWIAGYEEELRVVLAQRPFAQPAFMRGREV